jgi:hypothetical protein
MADQSAYPTSLDPVPTDLVATNVLSASVWNTYMDAIFNVETNVGITGSAVAASLDYHIKSSSSLNPGHKHTYLHDKDWETGTPPISGGSSQQNMLFGSLVYTWPSAQATTGAYLANNGAGVMSWGGKLRARMYMTAETNTAGGDTTQVLLDTIDFDSGGICDTSVGKRRITPGIAGYYLAIGLTDVSAVADGKATRASIFVNGANVAAGSRVINGVSTKQRSTCMDLLYLGATDYVELYVSDSDTDNAIGTGRDSTSLALFGPL